MCRFASVGHDETLLREVSARLNYEFRMSAGLATRSNFVKNAIWRRENKSRGDTDIIVIYRMLYRAIIINICYFVSSFIYNDKK